MPREPLCQDGVGRREAIISGNSRYCIHNKPCYHGTQGYCRQGWVLVAALGAGGYPEQCNILILYLLKLVGGSLYRARELGNYGHLTFEMKCLF